MLEGESWNMLPGVLFKCSSSGYGNSLFLLGNLIIYVPLQSTVLTWWPRPVCVWGVLLLLLVVVVGSWKVGQWQFTSQFLRQFPQDSFLLPVWHLWDLSVPELLSPLQLISSPCDLGCGLTHQYDSVLSYFWKSTKFCPSVLPILVFQHCCKFMLFKNRFSGIFWQLSWKLISIKA